MDRHERYWNTDTGIKLIEASKHTKHTKNISIGTAGMRVGYVSFEISHLGL
jgi:hypothetical protein